MGVRQKKLSTIKCAAKWERLEIPDLTCEAFEGKSTHWVLFATSCNVIY
jgi:hypothetical protein